MAITETKANQNLRLSPLEMTLGEQFREDVAGTLSNRIVSTIAQRGLEVYSEYGQPAKGYQERLQPKVDRMTIDASIRLDFNRRKYMGILVPKLVEALLGDPKDVSRVYEPSLSSTVATALDWFRTPDAVGETQFRVGFGGNEEVGSRGPSYLEPTLNTVDAVRRVYAEYENWATLNTLYDKQGRGNQEEIDKVVTDALRKRLPKDEKNRQNLLEEVQDSKRLSPELINQAITEAWGTLTGKPLSTSDKEEIKDEYRISDKLPQIVVFNAGNAAKVINGMDPQKVDTARNINQDLIIKVAETTHPEVAKNIRFQNDLFWNPNDFYTKMMVLYTRHLVGSLNGKHHQVDETLAQFGEHHQKTEGGAFGLTSSEAYEALHPQFFEDYLQGKDPSETLPRPAVMEPMPVPRHRRVDQARPEIRFGVARKYFQENATVSGMIEWLGSRYETATLKLDSAAQQVQQQATLLYEKPAQGKDKDKPKIFKTSLGRVIQGLNVPKETKDRLRDFLTTDESFSSGSIKNAQTAKENDEKTVDEKIAELNAAQQKAWQEITDRLNKEKITDNPWHLERLIYRLMEYQERVGQLKKDVNLAVQRGDNEALRELIVIQPAASNIHPAINLDFADTVTVPSITYPLTSAEYVVNRGSQVPTYYARPESDTRLYPDPELPSAEQYVQAAEDANAVKDRLNGTLKTAEKKYKQDPNENTSERTHPKPIDDAADLATWLLTIDKIETSGNPRGAMELLNAGIIVNNRNISADQQKTLFKDAGEILMKKPSEDVSQSEAVRYDYLSLLDSLNPNDREKAEALYHGIIADVLAPYGLTPKPNAARKDLVLA